jgi:RNA polymerase sigma factor (sigma-70 family)
MVLTDADLRTLLAEDAERGWRAFIDAYTPTLLAAIERAGVTDHDEAMEIYLLACERLAADDCARLRRHDPAKGPLRAWLSVLVRHVVVDWIRSRAGRRRLFGVVRDIGEFDRRVFELYYWDDRMPTEIAGIVNTGSPDVAAVLDALARIDAVLTTRHRAELMAMGARRRHAISLDVSPEITEAIRDASPDAEAALAVRDEQRRLDAALGRLAPEDAAVVRLKFIHGLSTRGVRDALHLPALPETRITSILQRLRELMTTASVAIAAVTGILK